MKLMKKLTSVILTLTLFTSLFLTNVQTSEAAVSTSVSDLKKAVPAKVRIMPAKEYTSGGYSSNDTIYVPFASHKNCIANIKVSKNALKAKVTREYKHYSGLNYDSHYGIIGLYCEKEGTYKVSFDVLKEKGGKKLYSKTVTVYVKSDDPIKSFKYAGSTNTWDVQTKAKGKLSVKMAKGYKLKSIEVGKYVYKDKEIKNSTNEYGSEQSESQITEMVYTKVKNNSTITLGTIPYYDSSYSKSNYQYSDDSTYNYYSKYLWTRILAETSIKVTYTDKYTKKDVTVNYTLYRLAK